MRRDELVDNMTYIPQPQQIEGNQSKVVVTDWNTQQLLENVIKELQKMNIQMELLSDNRVTDQEIT